MRLTPLALLALCSCASMPLSAPDGKKFYRLDLDLVVNGLHGSGITIVPQAKDYMIKASPNEKPEVVVITTCHRESILGKQGSEFVFNLAPTEVELNGYCPLQVSAFSQKFWYQSGIVSIRTPDYKMPAQLLCNGAVSDVEGVSGCQSRAGLVQEIHFESAMNAGVPSQCPAPRALAPDGLKFEFRPASGQCVFQFRERAAPFREHRLTSYGYDELTPTH